MGEVITEETQRPHGAGMVLKTGSWQMSPVVHPSGTWQQSSTDSHLLPPFSVALLLPVTALTSLLATTRTSLQGEAGPLHEFRTQIPSS